MNLAGLTLIKNGNLLNYPWKECIKSLAGYCSQVLVATAYSKDNTLEELNKLCEQYPHVRFVMTDWVDKNTGDGRVLADVVNELLPMVESEWVVYMQADEMLHELQTNSLKMFIDQLGPEYSQIELFRTYFYKDLKTRLAPEELYLGRVFKKGTHKIGGDGMHLIRESGKVFRVTIPIFHYSRIGTEEQITARIRTLDRLFHPEETVETFKTFTFDRIDEAMPYNGSHPALAYQFYSEKE